MTQIFVEWIARVPDNVNLFVLCIGLLTSDYFLVGRRIICRGIVQVGLVAVDNMLSNALNVSIFVLVEFSFVQLSLLLHLLLEKL